MLEGVAGEGSDRAGERSTPGAATSGGAIPALRSIGWPGTDDRREGCSSRPCFEPPDPGVAVGPNHVLHVVEHRLSIHDRSGALLEQALLADLFAPLTESAVGGYGETMPNVHWSGVHHRWLVAQGAWDCRHGWLELAVSRSGDPLAAWTLYRIDFGGYLPSFAALAASEVSVAITADHIPVVASAPSCLGTTRAGASVTVLDWAELLDAAASLTVAYTRPDRALLALRPAANIIGGWAVHLVGVAIDGSGRWDVGYARLSGRVTGTGSEEIRLSDPVDLTTTLGLSRFSAPPAPRLPGGETLVEARDARPTWAVAREGRLWFVAAASCRPAGDPDVRSCVRVVELDVAAAPLLVQDLRLGGTGLDTYGGAIGVSAAGALFVLRARSSSTSSIQTVASYRRPSDPVGTLRPGALVLTPGSYAGERWGRVVRMSPDPVESSAVWPAAARATSGGWATWVSKLTPDRSSAPSGSLLLAGGAATARSTSIALTLSGPAEAATTLIRCSNATTIEGGLLTPGRTYPAARTIIWSLSDRSTGGSGANGTRRVACQFGDGAGRWSSPVSDTIVLDTAPPTVGSVRPLFPSRGTLGTSTVPVGLTWSAADVGTGVYGREIHLRMEDGVYGVLANLPAWLLPGHLYRFRVRVVDGAGNWSSWSYGPASNLVAYQETSSAITYRGTWSTYQNPPAYGGATRYATRPGSSASLSFTGRAVAIVSATGPTRGRAFVYVDGNLAATLDLHSDSSAVRQLVFAWSWSSAGSHVLRLVVEGTADHPRVDLDAILVQT